MRNNNDGQKQQGDGFIPTSFRALSNYMRIVSSGASTVASTVRSAAASAIADRDTDGSQEVLWAGFEKLENEDGITRQVLLLGYRSGFQVWDVEDADNVHGLVSKHDDPVFFMQMLPQPITSKRSDDLFADSRPLLAVSADGSPSGVGDTVTTACNGMTSNCRDPVNGGLVPTVVRFYSLRSQSYVHVLKFRSCVYSVRSSGRVVAVSQAVQIHCFNAATLDKEYTILTNPVTSGCSGFGGIGYGPLAVGPRWLAYSGSPAEFSNYGRVNSQHLPPASYPSIASNGSLVAHYAKESSKQLAAGIFTLGDMGCKKLSKYYSELLPDSNSSPLSPGLGGKVGGAVSGHSPDAENEGMVIVRDVVSKVVIAQFRAHRSPISSLCFDPSGTLLATASVQGHNINVFRIMPGLVGSSSGTDAETCYAHLYTLQRGITNAVIRDISFSYDSHWIVVTSSRGTSHLFAISPSGGPVVFQPSYDCGMTKPGSSWPPTSGLQILNPQNLCASGPPITLSVVCRIRSGSSSWRGAAAAATGMGTSQFGAVASAFHKCKGNVLDAGTCLSKARYHLLVFSPCSLIQYALHASLGSDSMSVGRGLSSPYDMASESDAKFLVEAIQKWNIRKKQTLGGMREDTTDIYGENLNSGSSSQSFSEVKEEGEFGGGHNEAKDLVTNKSNMKSSTEEKHNFFISEAELQMHQLGTPLWARPQIYFQSMTIDGAEIDSDASRGEFEIEKIPAFMIEARSKSFVPACDYLQTPSVNQTRTSSPRGSITDSSRRLQHQTSALSQKAAVILGSSSSGTNESTNEGDVAVTYLDSSPLKEGRTLEGPRMVAETPPPVVDDSVNNSDSLESSSPPLEMTVNNSSESFVKEEGDSRVVDSKIQDFESGNQLKGDIHEEAD